MTKHLSRTFVLLMVLFCASASWAQEGSGRRIEKLLPEAGGIAHLSYTFNSRSDFKQTPAEDIALHAFDVGGSFPIPISDSIIFMPGIGYKLHHFRINNIAGYFPQSGMTLHHIQVPLNTIFFLSDNWMLSLNATPIIASDFKGFNAEAFQVSGALTAGWAFAEEASMFFGVGIGKDFWRYMPFPLLGFVYRPNDSFFSLEAILPAYARFNFKVAKPVTLFLAGEFEGMLWDVNGQGTIPQHFAKFYDSRAGGGAQFKIIDGLLIDLWGGINPFRRFELRNAAGAKVTRREKMGFFAKTQLVITPALFGL